MGRAEALKTRKPRGCRAFRRWAILDSNQGPLPYQSLGRAEAVARGRGDPRGAPRAGVVRVLGRSHRWAPCVPGVSLRRAAARTSGAAGHLPSRSAERAGAVKASPSGPRVSESRSDGLDCRRRAELFRPLPHLRIPGREHVACRPVVVSPATRTMTIAAPCSGPVDGRGDAVERFGRVIEHACAALDVRDVGRAPTSRGATCAERTVGRWRAGMRVVRSSVGAWRRVPGPGRGPRGRRRGRPLAAARSRRRRRAKRAALEVVEKVLTRTARRGCVLSREMLDS